MIMRDAAKFLSRMRMGSLMRVVHLVSTRAHARSCMIQRCRKPARSNTSVDALNTAIILCLVGTVGGWRGRNGWPPTICGKSAATKGPRRGLARGGLAASRHPYLPIYYIYWVYIVITICIVSSLCQSELLYPLTIRLYFILTSRDYNNLIFDNTAILF